VATTPESDDQPQAVELTVPIEQVRSVLIKMYFFTENNMPKGSDELDAAPAAGTGTAFFYRLDGQLYLITARHCFSPRSWETGQWIRGSHHVEPTHLAIWIRKRPPGGKWDISEPAPAARFLCPLLDTDGRPIWFEHPLAGPGMDVAVYLMPDFITDDDSLLIDAYTPATTGGNDVRNVATVAQDVFVVGYPYGLESGFQMPLWIRGTIASEPSMYYPHQGPDGVVRELPVLIVDARTREGQSGSPAILYRQPLTPVYTNDGQIRMTQASSSRLLGVYSGRTSAQSDLGFVWRIEQVDVICRTSKLARLDHQWPLPPIAPERS
jgi:hypothetical protein